MESAETRCRLVLIVPDIADAAEQEKLLGDALRGGDVASVIIPQYALGLDEFQMRAEKLVALVQNYDAAAIIAGDSRVAGRARADGIHIDGGAEAVAEAVEKFSPKFIVGAGHSGDRHEALEIGEKSPDYILFGKLDGDSRPQAHPKNLELGEWWASLVEIPCIVMGGGDPASAMDVAATWAEFVGLGRAIFSAPGGPAAMVAQINAVLDEKAPRFEY
ncbi:thiamine phosphate synthase [Martelella alba]|uniref:Thiamine phosphate synthase n=1 Tax=Martelella alba TaxID=2590451 RepID=A0A506UAV9_9HYPH|nr:thiamine phosphate synthase [Martelella alba]TPW30085.1 thiamine phosphate synthase [Martelella alba]